jgi:hypothetical protein
MLPSLTVVVVSRKDILVFDTSCVNFIDGWILTTKQRLGDLRHHLKKRGYNDKVIESGFSKASEIKRNYLLGTKKNRSTNGFPLFSLTILL